MLYGVRLHLCGPKPTMFKHHLFNSLKGVFSLGPSKSEIEIPANNEPFRRKPPEHF